MITLRVTINQAIVILLILFLSTSVNAQESKSDAVIRGATNAIMTDYENTAANDIHRFCAAEWSEDFVMQKHCVEQQTQARDKAQKVDVMASSVAMKTWANCTSEWTDKNSKLTDWVMMYHCYEEQISAYRSLNS